MRHEPLNQTRVRDVPPSELVEGIYYRYDVGWRRMVGEGRAEACGIEGLYEKLISNSYLHCNV